MENNKRTTIVDALRLSIHSELPFRTFSTLDDFEKEIRLEYKQQLTDLQESLKASQEENQRLKEGEGLIELEDRILELRSELSRLSNELESCRAEKWISVDEKLPETRKPVLLLTSYGKMATSYITEPENPTWGWTDWMRAEHGYGSVTHWMPLPTPPQERNIL